MALRIPSPVALTKPEAYLAYKAGILSRGELKDKLLNPINNYEGWLAKWCELLETYPTNEDGTPQCLTDEEGLLAYLCGVTNRYPASNSNPDDARVSAYIRYLISARYARPDHPLNREEFYLSLIKTQFIPSGDPSSDIVIDGTTKAPFLDVKVYGDTLQNSYSGKNLMPPTWAQDFVNAVNNSVQASLATEDGKTCLSFKPNAGYGSYATKNFTLGVTFEPNTQYTVSFDQKSEASNRHVAIYYTDNTYTAPTASATDTWEKVTITSEAGKSVAYIAPFYTSGDTYIDINTFQIEKGSTATSYEPYVGGIPAPNPSYPQPISVVTGENVVKVVGKNLLDETALMTYLSANGATVEDATYDNIEATRLYKNGTGGLTISYPLDLPDGQYTVSLNYATEADADFYLRFVYSDGTFDGIKSGASTSWTNVTKTTKASKKLVALRFMFYAGSATKVYIGKNSLQLELGNQATSYQAYTAQDYTISLGELELAKIGTYQDRIYKEGEKWYVEKNVGKQVLADTDILSVATSYTNVNYAAVRKASDFIGKGDYGYYNVLCDRATSGNVNSLGGYDSSRMIGRINSQAGKQEYYVGFPTGLTLKSARAALSSSSIYYPLATPTVTEITNQSLIDQLNALKQGGAEEDTTYIRVSATDPNLPAKLYVEAPKYD